jgi:hypothetical protein
MHRTPHPCGAPAAYPSTIWPLSISFVLDEHLYMSFSTIATEIPKQAWYGCPYTSRLKEVKKKNFTFWGFDFIVVAKALTLKLIC